MPFTAEELLERRDFIGASEASAAIGLSDWFTPLQLFKSKRGEGEPIEETIPMMVGTALEPVVIRLFEKETGLKVTDQQAKLIDPLNPWRRATIDGRASDGALIEAKTSGQWSNWGKGEDEVPIGYLYQCHHTFACDSSLKSAYVPVILSQRQFRLYRIERNDELIELLTVGETEFMRRVHENDPPPPMDTGDLKILYPIDFGIELVATAEIESIAYQLAETKAKITALESLEDQQAFRIKEFMGTAAILKGQEGILYTYKSNIERRLNVTSFRKDHPGLAEQYSPEKTVRKLLNKIKVK